MTEEARGVLEYSLNGREYRYSWEGQNFPRCQGLLLAGGVEGHRSYLDISPLEQDKEGTQIRMKRLEWKFPFSFSRDDRIFVNGYQSWTGSWERGADESLPGIPFLGKLIDPVFHLKKYGDYGFVKTSFRPGDLHGFTYAYVRPNGGSSISLFGSLSEAEGFTLFRTSVKDGLVKASWDCEGLILNRKRRVLDLFYSRGEDEDVFDAYFRSMEITAPEAPRSLGWTSWYNYYQNINETIILDNLEALRSSDFLIDTFQIDDGYQTMVGDWLSVDEQKFPRGLVPLVKEIHASGYRAGLWLAPFSCQKKSRLAQDHPDWLLRDRKGKPVTAGINWGGFYALDFYRQEVRDYLKEVFRTVFSVWHFDMVKLDFLYGVCLAPPGDKTRGEVMREAMVFLRECAGDKMILGCGVPLGSAFGLVDYCRIGCDVGLDWDNSRQRLVINREGVSTRNALGNALGRRHLNGRAFMNDPDVFLLRDTNIKLSDREKETLLRVNSVTGSLIFTSDLVSEYDNVKKALFREVLSPKELQEVTRKGGVYRIKYLEGRRERVLLVNLSEHSSRYDDFVLLPRESVLLEAGSPVNLRVPAGI